MEWRCKTTASRAGEGAVQPRARAIDDGGFACSVRPEKNNVETVGPPYALGTIDQPAKFVADKTSRTSQDRTPGVSSIPVLGNLFKRKGVTRNTNEILFFITPRITRPDFTATSSGRPANPTIIQPVPMGNPPSNSTPVEPAPQPIVLQAPGLAAPEAVPVQLPKKP